tara:strand:- start:787 stop:1743 length:957 start_codon:yes stop_codon:yes gene_type:complete
MIVVTGGAGFIGSNLINFLGNQDSQEVISVDWKNDENAHYFKNKKLKKVSPDNLEFFLTENYQSIKLIIHLGAITSTTETNAKLIIKNNINLSLFIWSWCVQNNKRLIYASSAATYGDGSNNFDDQEKNNYLSKLIPLNLYGWSKHLFDKFIINQKKKPPQYVGLKFFNVYGPNELHKSEMRSIVLKIFQKVSNKQDVKLFKSHNPKYRDGEQMRDFIYIKDVISIIGWFINNKDINGIFNVGTGEPRSFQDLAFSVFKNSNTKNKIKYIDTPKNIREQYQYYTKANIKKLRNAGYKRNFFSLEDGIKDYIRNHLIVD